MYCRVMLKGGGGASGYLDPCWLNVAATCCLGVLPSQGCRLLAQWLLGTQAGVTATALCEDCCTCVDGCVGIGGLCLTLALPDVLLP
jgi:hypothetical protein